MEANRVGWQISVRKPVKRSRFGEVAVIHTDKVYLDRRAAVEAVEGLQAREEDGQWFVRSVDLIGGQNVHD